jgi:hypothetical protein
MNEVIAGAREIAERIKSDTKLGAKQKREFLKDLEKQVEEAIMTKRERFAIRNMRRLLQSFAETEI